MKKYLLILGLFLASSVSLFAQDAEDDDEGNEKIRDKMSEYIQKRLNLSNDEAKKFTPVFIEYFKEWRQTLQTYRGPEKKLERQQKVIELQIRFRSQFQAILGEKRGNRVYEVQQRFLLELQQLRRNRPANTRPLRRGA